MEVDARARAKMVKGDKENPGKREGVEGKASATKVKCQGEVPKQKKWREKDKRMLFERVKEKYLQLRKMRVNIIRVDPYKKYKKCSQRKRSKKKL